MAVDTRNKRMSMLALSLPRGRVLPNPDGGFTTAPDRRQLEYLYAFTVASAFSPAWAVNANQIVTPYGEQE